MGETNEITPANRLKTFFSTLPGILTGVAAIVTALAALAGVFWPRDEDEGTGSGGLSATSVQTQQPQVELLLPQPGRVEWKTRVQLRYSDLGQDSDLWIIERSGDQYYPQPRCPGEQPTVRREPGVEGGPWDGAIQIGTASSAKGTPFELIVLLTRQQATQLLSQQIRGWCDPDKLWPGISQLPKVDADVKDRVTVFR